VKPNAVVIETIGNSVTVRSPYNVAFVEAARNHGGRWDSAANAWTFDARTESRVRETVRNIYGPGATENYESVTARFDACAWWRHDPTGDDSNCYFAGRKILWRRGRDHRVEMGDGVVLAEGTFNTRGGSVRNPSLDIDHGTIVEVYDVPAGHPDLDHPCVTIVAQPADEPAPVDTQALLIERERLTARLAEINAILSGYGFGCGCGDHEMIHALPVIDEQRTKATEDAVNGPAGTTGDGK
jgi:hypothetical protein